MERARCKHVWFQVRSGEFVLVAGRLTMKAGGKSAMSTAQECQGHCLRWLEGVTQIEPDKEENFPPVPEPEFVADCGCCGKSASHKFHTYKDSIPSLRFACKACKKLVCDAARLMKPPLMW